MKSVILFLLACMTPNAFAGVFNVSPVRVELAPRRTTQPLTLTNNGEEPLVVQIQAMQWTQEKEEEKYTPSDEVLATPPIITIPAHGSQTVRVGLRREIDPNRELSYRLYLTEIAGSAKTQTTGIQMRFRISLPVFVAGNPSAKPVLKWNLVHTAEGKTLLQVKNAGTVHAQIADIRLSPPDSEKVLARQNKGVYLLPGSAREWTLKPEPGQTIGMEALRLQAYMDADNVDSLLTPQKD